MARLMDPISVFFSLSFYQELKKKKKKRSHFERNIGVEKSGLGHRKKKMVRWDFFTSRASKKKEKKRPIADHRQKGKFPARTTSPFCSP